MLVKIDILELKISFVLLISNGKGVGTLMFFNRKLRVIGQEGICFGMRSFVSNPTVLIPEHKMINRRLVFHTNLHTNSCPHEVSRIFSFFLSFFRFVFIFFFQSFSFLFLFFFGKKRRIVCQIFTDFMKELNFIPIPTSAQ